MSLNKSQETRSCLKRWVSATTLLTTIVFSCVFTNKAEANHCGPLDFTGNCIHESSGSTIQVEPPKPIANPLTKGDHYIERVGAHCEWLLTNTKRTNKWNQIQLSAQKDAGNNNGKYYRNRIAEHCKWLLTHTGDTDKWNAIENSARKDAGIPLVSK